MGFSQLNNVFILNLKVRFVYWLELKGFVMGRKTGLEAGRAGPRSLFSVIVVHLES